MCVTSSETGGAAQGPGEAAIWLTGAGPLHNSVDAGL